MTEEPSTVGSRYEILSIKHADAPSGMEGTNWHQYVISFEGSSNIQGYQQGTLKGVTKAVEELVGQLNERHMGKRGRVNLVPTPKKTTQS